MKRGTSEKIKKWVQDKKDRQVEKEVQVKKEGQVQVFKKRYKLGKTKNTHK